MKRKRGNGRLIEKVKQGPFEAEIRMNEGGVFFCDYGGQCESGTLPEIRGWAKMRLREASKVEWIPIMSVSADDKDTRVNNLEHCSNMQFFVHRYWIAWDGKQWIECPWVVDRPGVFMCAGPANTDREQDEMPDADLMAQRIARSTKFYAGPNTPEINFPIVEPGHGRKTFHMQYNEERWQTFIGILDKIRELRAGINKLMETNKGWMRLATVAQQKLLK